MENKDLLNKILDIGIKINSVTSYHKLLAMIITESMDITNCDAGTLYIKKGDELVFMIMANHTFKQYQGFDGERVNVPPVQMNLDNVCSNSAITRKIYNIADVYNDNTFSWNGPKKYDSMTGYHTKSMVVIPLIDKSNEVIGVLQLLNAMDENKNVIPFSSLSEHIIFSIGSQAAIVLSNMLLQNEIEDLLDSMVDSLTTAIDSRTPYNANHSKNVAKYCLEYSKYAKENNLLELSNNSIEQLYLAARLHDVGKMIIPLEIMDKATKLGSKIEILMLRIDYIKAIILLAKLENKITEDEYNKKIIYINQAIEDINKANTIGYLADDLELKIKEYGAFEFEGIKMLDELELTDLLIKKGTLNQQERKIIEEHSIYSYNILSKIHFGKKYDKVLFLASAHHEYLDGSGYPNHLKANDLPIEVRILTMMDVFESLTAKDRPYKREMPVSKAYSIVCAMVKEGKLDENIVSILGKMLEDKGELN